MLHADGCEVRAYASYAAALADPVAIASDCVVADIDMDPIGGIALLRSMRSKGWRGAGILLADIIAPVQRMIAIDEGFVVMAPVALDDRRLLTAVYLALG